MKLLFSLFLFITLLNCSDKKTSNNSNTQNNTNTSNNTNNLNNIEDSRIVLIKSPSLPDAIALKVSALLGQAIGDDSRVEITGTIPIEVPVGSTVIYTGEHATQVIPEELMGSISEDSWIIRSEVVEGVTKIGIGACSSCSSGNGTSYGLLALLEHAGFAFLHPLKPVIPQIEPGDPRFIFNSSSSPRWERRGIHIHTMHPTELAHVLNGWGLSSMEDETSFQEQLLLWENTLLWALANGLNMIHWVLLESPDWDSFSRSELRLLRLTQLVSMAHDYNLKAGVDVPISLAQQNAFRLVKNPEASLEERIIELESSVDWLMQAGFDYLMTEAGNSEFTHGDPAETILLYDALSLYLKNDHNSTPVWIKVHCSSNQTAQGYADPLTGDDINYNFLVHYSNPAMGALPHTVQHYSLSDPAPTYGNTDFEFIRDFMYYEASERSVIWYPETAYWVSFDIDVPLFLPVYALNRYKDLHEIALDEDSGIVGSGNRIDGQFFFSSGWEFGYWLNDVVAARSSWNIDTSLEYQDSFRDFLVQRLYFPQDTADFITEYSIFQLNSYIYGKVNETSPPDVIKKNAQAYLQGWESWDDITKTGSTHMPTSLQMTQPDRIGLVDTKTNFTGFESDVKPLLDYTENQSEYYLSIISESILLSTETHDFTNIFYDFLIGVEINYLRATQIHGLYDYSDTWKDDPLKLDETLQAWRLARLETARTALDNAQIIINSYANNSLLPHIYSWGLNPTCYDFNYLWTAKSLYFWWRDEGKAVDAPLSPCYLNIINAAKTAGDEAVANLQTLFSSLSWTYNISECLEPPASEPQFPQDDLRSRP